jgi:hypothetical protein
MSHKIYTVPLLVSCLLFVGCQSIEQARRDAEIREFCRELEQYNEEVKAGVDQASRIELMGGVYMQGMYEHGCK